MGRSDGCIHNNGGRRVVGIGDRGLAHVCDVVLVGVRMKSIGVGRRACNGIRWGFVCMSEAGYIVYLRRRGWSS